MPAHARSAAAERAADTARRAGAQPAGPAGARRADRNAQVLDLQRRIGNRAVGELARAGGLGGAGRGRPDPAAIAPAPGAPAVSPTATAARSPARFAARPPATAAAPAIASRAAAAPAVARPAAGTGAATTIQRGLLGDLVQDATDLAGRAAATIADAAHGAVDAASAAVSGAAAPLQAGLAATLGRLDALWGAVKRGAGSAVEGVLRQAGAFLGGIGAAVRSLAPALAALDAGALRAAWAAVTGVVGSAATSVRAGVAQVTAAVDGLWAGLRGQAAGLIGGLGRTAEDLIGRLPGVAQGPARAIWRAIESRLSGAWRAIEEAWASLRDAAVERVRQAAAGIAAVAARLEASAIGSIIATIDRLKATFDFVRRTMADPDALVDPIVAEISARLRGLPAKARGGVEAKAHELAGSGPASAGVGPAAPGAAVRRLIQRDAAAAGPARTTLGIGQVLAGGWDFIADKLAKLWAHLGATIKEMVIGVIDPRAIAKGLKEDWAQMTKDLSLRAQRIEGVRTDSWDGFREDLSRWLSNLADFPLIIWRTVNAMLGRLSVYIGLAVILGGAVAGAIAAGTGGAIFGSVVPAAGTAAGGAAGIAAGAWAGAQAGYALSETIGLALLASFGAAEQLSIVKAINDLLWVPQSTEEQNEDFNQATDSAIAIATALLLMAIAFIGVALAKRVWAFVKGVPGRLRARPGPVETDPAARGPAGDEPVKPRPGSSDRLVVCRVCDIVPGVPEDLMAQRSKLSPEMRAFLDSRAAKFFPDPAHPTPDNFKALRGFMERAATKGGGDLEAGLRQMAPKAPVIGTPRGAAAGELPRLRSALEKLIGEIEEFAQANPDKPGIEKSAERLRQQLDGPVQRMENGVVEATPDQISTVERVALGAQGELERAKVAPPGTIFSDETLGAEIDQIRPDGTLVQVKKMRALRNPSRTFDDTVAQIKLTLQTAQNHPVGGQPRKVIFEFPQGLSKEVAADLRAVEVDGRHATIDAQEIIVPPK